jgi:hypothetical protein
LESESIYLSVSVFPTAGAIFFDALHAPMIGNDFILNPDRFLGDFEERLAEVVQVREPHEGGG